jgi:hypothetical protein
MKFHKYGPVEVAIGEPGPQDTEPIVLARYSDVTYRLRELPVRLPVRNEGDLQDEWVLDVPGDRDHERKLDRDGLESEQHIIGLLDAAATLCQQEFAEWQEADAKMGDPYP